jgi:peptidoglycan/LPS O-acetylase OafA/YrhL
MNPTSIDKSASSFAIAVLRSGYFAVDTFFFLSGFLAAHAVIEHLVVARREAFSVRFYFKTLLARYLRLTPSYAFTILFYWKVLPYLGTGPDYYAANNSDGWAKGSYLCKVLVGEFSLFYQLIST